MRAILLHDHGPIEGLRIESVPDAVPGPGEVLVKNIAIAGLQVTDYRDRDPAWMRSVQRELFDLYRAGRLKPHVSAELPLERVVDGYALFGRRACRER